MKKLLVACAVTVTALAPAAALAADPAPADYKNAAKECKALRAAAGTNNFVSMFGTKKNAYGKCVSQTAKKNATEDAAQEKTAKTNAAKECKGTKPFGKCVSEKAKAKKAAADKEDEAQQQDRISAAKTCKTAKKEDSAGFEKEFGTRRNAYGKCVSATAKKLAAERREQDTATS